jgi:hypothetical protein
MRAGQLRRARSDAPCQPAVANAFEFNFLWCFGRKKSDTPIDMDEKNEVEPRPQYRWPRILLGAVILGLVLAVMWMSVLVHRIREQRQYNMWGTPVRSVPQTNSTTKTN